MQIPCKAMAETNHLLIDFDNACNVFHWEKRLFSSLPPENGLLTWGGIMYNDRPQFVLLESAQPFLDWFWQFSNHHRGAEMFFRMHTVSLFRRSFAIFYHKNSYGRPLNFYSTINPDYTREFILHAFFPVFHIYCLSLAYLYSANLIVACFLPTSQDLKNQNQ